VASFSLLSGKGFPLRPVFSKLYATSCEAKKINYNEGRNFSLMKNICTNTFEV